MRHTLFAVLAIAMAGIANADMFLTVDGQVNPDPITITVNDSLGIGLWGDGATPMGGFFLGFDIGKGASLDISSANVLYPGIFAYVESWNDTEIAEILKVENPFLYIELTDPVMPPGTPAPLEGQLVDNIFLSPTNVGVITLGLFDGSGNPMDSRLIDVQQIYVMAIPEPMTIALLGLGALMLKRRR